MNSRVCGRSLVHVDLVAEQEQQVGPPLVGVADQLVGVDVERVDLGSVVVLVLGEDVGRFMRQREPARAEGDRSSLSGSSVRICAGREVGVAHRPAALAVQPHLVLGIPCPVPALDADQRVVVSVDAEGVLGVAEHLDLAGLVGLDPDRGVALAHVP